MPHYASWGAVAQHSRLPPTPPDSQNPYLTPMSAVSDQGYYAHGYHNGHSSSRDRSDRFSQLPAYSAQQSMATHAHPRMSHTQEYPTYATRGLGQYQYQPAPPMLPPIRVPDAIDPFAQYSQQLQKPKEEKPTGGVAQHLDYEMDIMASFVAESAQKLVGGHEPSASFRKFVSSILSSTRLPSSTIMLGLFYAQARIKLLMESGAQPSTIPPVHKLLTICLLLGSKFLDDNTFQNRSWSEVSQIPVRDLNVMEIDWLVAFNWEIHSMMYEDEEGFFDWVQTWHDYEQEAQAMKIKQMQKLSPIETSLRRSRSVQQQAMLSPDGPIPVQYQHGSQFDQWPRQFISEYSPPSAPHSGPATPEYYANQQWPYAPTPTTYDRQGWNGSAYSAQRSQQAFQNPTYQYGYQSAWAGHGPSCGCTLCAKHSEYYFTHGGYDMQPVVG